MDVKVTVEKEAPKRPWWSTVQLPLRTEEATRWLASPAWQFWQDRAELQRAVDALADARRFGAAWRWDAAERALARAYEALGAKPPEGATGYDWHRGMHPIQLERDSQGAEEAEGPK